MRKPKAPRLVTVAIFTTMTVIFWVFYSLYNVLISKPSINVNEEILSSIEPTLDTDSLNKLEGRLFFEEGKTQNIFTPQELTPTPTANLITETPFPSSIPTATPAGILP